MDVGMTALAVASLTSVALGLVLCLFFCVFRFGIKLFLPMQSRKWMREVWTFFKVVFSSVAILLFLYATNRGVFRWFLTAGVIAACLLTDRLLGRRLSRAGDGVSARVRRVALRCLAWITAPFRKIGRIIAGAVVAALRKLGLRVAAVYDKLMTKHYDRKRRSRLISTAREDLAGLLGGIN